MHVNKLSCCYFALVEINFCTCETVEHFCILRFEPKSHWRTPLLKSSALTVQVAVCVALTAKSFSPHGKVYRVTLVHELTFLSIREPHPCQFINSTLLFTHYGGSFDYIRVVIFLFINTLFSPPRKIGELPHLQKYKIPTQKPFYYHLL